MRFAIISFNCTGTFTFDEDDDSSVHGEIIVDTIPCSFRFCQMNADLVIEDLPTNPLILERTLQDIFSRGLVRPTMNWEQICHPGMRYFGTGIELTIEIP